MDRTPRMLIFTSRKNENGLPVVDEHGRVVANIAASWSGSRFSVSDPDGRQLCSASARWWSPGRWTVTDNDANHLLSMTTNLLKNRAIIHPAREGDLVLHGNAWGRGFTIRDADDRCVAGTGAGKASAGVASPDDVVRVEIPDALRLAEMISVVQIWRTAKKSAIASSTAVSSTVARGV